MGNEWYNVNVRSKMIKEAFKISALVCLVLISLLAYWFTPSVQALRQPVVPKDAIEVKTCTSVNFNGGDVFASGDAACQYECYSQGDSCIRCSHACINHPALVLNVWSWYELCYVPLDNGLVVSEYACCNPFLEYCHEVCVE